MKKRMIILLQIIIATVLIGNSVYAAINTTLNLKTTTNTLKRGEEYSVTLALKDVDSANKVLNVEGYINYDENIFEKLTVDSIVKDSDNEVTIGDEKLPVRDLTDITEEEAANMPSLDTCVIFNGNPKNNNDARIIIELSKAIEEDLDLVTIKFKVKEDATLGKVTDAIKYELFDISAESEDVLAITKKLDVTIQEKASSNENETDNNTVTNNTENKATNNTTNNKTNNTTNNTANNNASSVKNTIDNTVAGTNLPATGVRAIIIPAIILILCAYISYNQYMKYKKI